MPEGKHLENWYDAEYLRAGAVENGTVTTFFIGVVLRIKEQILLQGVRFQNDIKIYLAYQKRMVVMILGNPYKFSVFISTIKEWNIDNEFCNGVLLFCIEGNIFPKKLLLRLLNMRFSY